MCRLEDVAGVPGDSPRCVTLEGRQAPETPSLCLPPTILTEFWIVQAHRLAVALMSVDIRSSICTVKELQV